MLTIICITILAYWIMGKEIDSLLKKVKNYDWRGKINELYIKIRPYALKAGRTATRPLLQFYYVMVDSFFLPNYFVGRLSPLPNGHIKPRNGEKFGAVYSPEDEETAPNTVYHT